MCLIWICLKPFSSPRLNILYAYPYALFQLNAWFTLGFGRDKYLLLSGVWYMQVLPFSPLQKIRKKSDFLLGFGWDFPSILYLVMIYISTYPKGFSCAITHQYYFIKCFYICDELFNPTVSIYDVIYVIRNSHSMYDLENAMYDQISWQLRYSLIRLLRIYLLLASTYS